MSAARGPRAEDLVNGAVGARLQLSDEPPGVRSATVEAIANRIDAITDRMRVQFNHLRTGSSRHIPDAYFADEQEAENELQEAAAGLRAAMATVGILGDAREIELSLAEDLRPTSLWARLSEASRVPRPHTRPELLWWTRSPVSWLEDGGAWPPPEAKSLETVRQIGGQDTWAVPVDEAPYEGWIQLAFVEHQTTYATRHPAVPWRRLSMMAGLEASDGPPPPGSAPLSTTSPAVWAKPITALLEDSDTHRSRLRTAVTEGPLAALTSYVDTPGAPLVDRGAGHHRFCLTPRWDLVASLGLRPTRPAIRHLLIDTHGPAMICRQWRSYMIPVEDYGPLVPAVLGADLILRPDLMESLGSIVGTARLRLGFSLRIMQGSDALDADE